MNELEKAQKAAEAAQKALADAEAKEAERQAEIAAKRAEREREYSAKFLSGWRERAGKVVDHNDRVSHDYDPKTMAFLEPVIELVARSHRRRAVLDAASQAERVLDVPSNQSTIPESRFYSVDVISHLQQIVSKEAARRGNEVVAELEAEREAFLNGS
ncbi:hypothetical protein [Streptomyces hygroscopicus]|uniref:hypothetical protein n=1 Tax=Streptomyces hygroscopicus TaxID=1912 RepID=UPI0004CA1571|nr:hypothetical protein [Streptomyces hygroscopicus]